MVGEVSSDLSDGALADPHGSGLTDLAKVPRLSPARLKLHSYLKLRSPTRPRAIRSAETGGLGLSTRRVHEPSALYWLLVTVVGVAGTVERRLRLDSVIDDGIEGVEDIEADLQVRPPPR
jgi:hypothetical protein